MNFNELQRSGEAGGDSGPEHLPCLHERVLLCNASFRCVHASPCTQLVGHQLDNPLAWELAGLPSSMADCLRTTGEIAIGTGQPMQVLVPGDSGSCSEGACLARLTPIPLSGACFLLLHLRALTWWGEERGLQVLARSILASDAFAACTVRLPDWKVEHAARGLASLLGTDPDSLHGKSLLSHFENPGDPVRLMQAVACGRSIRNVQVPLVSASGDSVPAVLSATRSDALGTPSLLLMFTRCAATAWAPAMMHRNTDAQWQTRESFVAQVSAAMMLAAQGNVRIAVLFVDVRLDGGPGGAAAAVIDREASALAILGRRLQQVVRSHDAVTQTGNGFAVLLRRLHAGEDAGLVAERLRFTLGKPLPRNGGFVQVSARVGIAPYPSGISSATALLECAASEARASRPQAQRERAAPAAARAPRSHNAP